MDRGVVVIGGFVNGLGAVRALAGHGIRTAVVVTKPYDIAHRSRFAVGHEPALGVEEAPEFLVEALERRARDWAGWALLPMNDEAVVALSEHRERLSRSYSVLAAPDEAVHWFVDKERMEEIARAVGVDLPRCHGRVGEALADPDIRFPVLVKPIVGYRFYARFGCKLFVANDPGELRAAATRLAEVGIPAQVFDYVPGPDRQVFAYCLYMDERGEPSAGVTVRKVRQGPPFFGIARVAEVIDEIPALREVTIEMLRRGRHRGFAAAEFKLDPRDGKMRFIEVNIRSVVYNGLLRRAGLDPATLIWTDLVRGERPRVEARPWSGAWIHLHSDVLHSIFSRRQDPIAPADFLAPYRREKEFAVWSASDQAPFWAEWSRTARSAAASLLWGKKRDAVERMPAAATAPQPATRGLASETTARNF